MISGTLFILGQTLAHNVETLFITRFIAGVFAAAPITNCSGVLYYKHVVLNALLISRTSSHGRYMGSGSSRARRNLFRRLRVHWPSFRSSFGVFVRT
jgi:hypothetical protein